VRALSVLAFLAGLLCSPEGCRGRDPKGALEAGGTGRDHCPAGAGVPYEVPQSREIRVDTERLSVEEAAHQILKELYEQGFFAADSASIQ